MTPTYQTKYSLSAGDHNIVANFKTADVISMAAKRGYRSWRYSSVVPRKQMHIPSESDKQSGALQRQPWLKPGITKYLNIIIIISSLIEQRSYTLSEAWSGVNWADRMAAQGAFGTNFYYRSTRTIVGTMLWKEYRGLRTTQLFLFNHLTRVIGDVENLKIFTSIGNHDHTHDRRSPNQLNHRGWLI